MTFRPTLLLSAAAWIIQILAPLAHLPHDHEGRSVAADCQECPTAPDQVAMEEACAPLGPCERPDHHHHHGDPHRDSPCLVCKTLLSRLLGTPRTQALSLPWQVALVVGPATPVHTSQEQSSHPARGPPAQVA